MRASSTITNTAAAVAAFSSFATAFTATSKTNLVTYWGQGPNQGSLQEVCKNPNVDIVNIGFINVFPDQGKGGWPGSNFGNACGSETYEYNGTSTQLLSNCPNIGTDIAICQQVYGKKIFLSIGGAEPNNYYIKDDASAVNFANFLWGAFGPVKDEWTKTGGPRPFGDAVVDGFDFDIESELSSAPTVNGKTISNYKTNGYAKMISTFKQTLYPQDAVKSYYISGAPQCVVPDEHFASVVASAWFDFLFVQYYNTPACSARQAVSSGSFTGYNNWASAKSLNGDVKIFVGLPASTDASADASYYLRPTEVKGLVSKVYSNTRFGGIMVWDSTYAANHVICNRNYLTWMKQILNAQADGTNLNTVTSPCPAQPISRDGTCGGYTGYTCAGSMFGSCCSKYGYCGSSADYCSAANCDSTSGKCGSLSSSSSSKKVSSTSSSKKISSTSSKKISSTSSKRVSSTSSKRTSSSVKATSSVVSRKAAFFAGDNNSTALVGTAPASAIIAPFGTGIAAAVGTGGLVETGGLVGTAVTVAETIYGTAPVSGAKATPSAGFPQVAPYSNSTSPKAYGNAVANGNNAVYSVIDTTVIVTSTVYQTQIQTVTRTDAQGAESTEYVTETVKVYTTVFPVATQVATKVASPDNTNSGSNSGNSNSGSNASSNYDNTNSGSSSSSSEVADQSGKNAGSDTLPAAAYDIRYTAVTKTVYKTAFVTATIRQSVMTYTTSYPLSTVVEYAPTNSVGNGNGNGNSMSTSTTTVRTTRFFTETIRVGASAAPFAFNNASVAALHAASGTVQVNAAYTPASVQSSSSSSSAAAVSASVYTSAVVIVQTQTIVPVASTDAAAAAGPTAGTASNSRVYSSNDTTPYKRSTVDHVAIKGAASNVHTDIGLCAIALIVGMFFVL